MLPLLLFAAAQAPNPAMLVIYTYQNGYQFVPFTTYARCETVRKMLQHSWDEQAKAMFKPGTQPAFPPQAVCVEG